MEPQFMSDALDDLAADNAARDADGYLPVSRASTEDPPVFTLNGVRITLERSAQNPNCYRGKISGKVRSIRVRGEITQFIIGLDSVCRDLAYHCAQVRRVDCKDTTDPQRWAVEVALLGAMEALTEKCA